MTTKKAKKSLVWVAKTNVYPLIPWICTRLGSPLHAGFSGLFVTSEGFRFMAGVFSVYPSMGLNSTQYTREGYLDYKFPLLRYKNINGWLRALSTHTQITTQKKLNWKCYENYNCCPIYKIAQGKIYQSLLFGENCSVFAKKHSRN